MPAVTELWVGCFPRGPRSVLDPSRGGADDPALSDLPAAEPVRLVIPDGADADPVRTPLALDRRLTRIGRRLDTVVVALPPPEALLDGRPLPRGGTAAHRRAEWVERACRVVVPDGADPAWLSVLQPDAVRHFPDADPVAAGWDPHRAERRSAWVQALNGDLSRPVLEARRPLHPARAAAWLLGPWPGVRRARGFTWTIDRPDVVAEVDRIGPHPDLRAAGVWWVASPRRTWPTDPVRLARLQADWHPDFGDRITRIVLLGDPDADALTAGFEAALVRPDEVDPGWHRSALVPDPFPGLRPPPGQPAGDV